MAASSGPSLDEHTFFDGRLTRPDVTARLLLVLSHIVRTHFYDARPPPNGSDRDEQSQNGAFRGLQRLLRSVR